MTPICINIVQLTGQLTDRSNILRCQLGSDEWQIGKREKGTSIALPFTVWKFLIIIYVMYYGYILICETHNGGSVDILS